MDPTKLLALLLEHKDKSVRIARDNSCDVDFELMGELIHDSAEDDPAPSEPENHKFTVREGSAWLTFIVSQVEECYAQDRGRNTGMLQIIIR